VPLGDESFLGSVNPGDIDNNEGLSLRERELLLVSMRFFFGPANAWGVVRNVSDPTSLAHVADLLHQPGERFDRLESETSLPAGYFSTSHSNDGCVRLYAGKQVNQGYLPSYYLYEERLNLTLYIGPDFLHGIPDQVVVNCMPLDGDFRPRESYTLRL
jgi:hypothetical protein